MDLRKVFPTSYYWLACWPLIPKFVGANPAEAIVFFRAKKSLAYLPSEGK
jgi:hypothetical protein